MKVKALIQRHADFLKPAFWSVNMTQVPERSKCGTLVTLQ